LKLQSELQEERLRRTPESLEKNNGTTEAVLKWLIWHVFGGIQSLKADTVTIQGCRKQMKKTNSGGPFVRICFAALISMVKNMFIFVMWGPGKVIILIYSIYFFV